MSEKHVASTLGRIVRLVFRGGRCIQDFLEKQILVKSRGDTMKENQMRTIKIMTCDVIKYVILGQSGNEIFFGTSALVVRTAKNIK